MKRDDIEKIIKKYNISSKDEKIRIPGNYANAAKADGVIDIVKANKAEFLNVLSMRELESAAKHEERKRRIATIEGLEEIERCKSDWNKWHEAFEHMMNTGSSIMTVSVPNEKEEDLRKKYPRANAYLIARGYANKSNYEISGIGSKALERIIFEDHYEQVIADMEKELSELCKEHMWD